MYPPTTCLHFAPNSVAAFGCRLLEPPVDLFDGEVVLVQLLTPLFEPPFAPLLAFLEQFEPRR